MRCFAWCWDDLCLCAPCVFFFHLAVWLASHYLMYVQRHISYLSFAGCISHAWQLALLRVACALPA